MQENPDLFDPESIKECETQAEKYQRCMDTKSKIPRKCLAQVNEYIKCRREHSHIDNADEDNYVTDTNRIPYKTLTSAKLVERVQEIMKESEERVRSTYSKENK